MESPKALPPPGCSDATADVVVAGAGPVGLTLGCVLRELGLDVVIVDPHLKPSGQSKASMTMPRTLEVLDSLGVASAVAQAGRPVRAGRLAVGGRWLGEFAGLQRRRRDCRFVPLAVGQNVIEAALDQRFADLNGRIFRGARVVRAANKDQGVEVSIERYIFPRPPPTDQPSTEAVTATTLTARFLVGADGSWSQVREAVGATFTGNNYPQAFILADVEIQEEELDIYGLRDHEIHCVLGENAVMVFIHVQGRTWRTYLSTSNLNQAPVTEQFIREQWSRHFPAPGFPERARFGPPSPFKISCRMVDKYRLGSIFLAGDAAHCHSPAGAQGMNTGVQDAYNLGWKLSAVLKGQAAETLLDTYEKERRPVAAWVLGFTDRGFSGMSATSVSKWRRALLGCFVAVAPRTALPPKHTVEQLQGLSISYAGNSTCTDTGERAPRGALVAGDRLPDLPCCTSAGGLMFLHRSAGPAHDVYRLMLVGHQVPTPAELEAAAAGAMELTRAGAPAVLCTYTAPAPDPWWRPLVCGAQVPARPRAAPAVPELVGGLVVLSLAPVVGDRRIPTLDGLLKLRRGGRAVLAVRPDDHIAVVHRGSWDVCEVAKALRASGAGVTPVAAR